MVQAYQSVYASGKHNERYADPDWYRGVSERLRSTIVQTLMDYRLSGSVVDCGAGWGFLVERMIQEGYQARGVEFSQDQVAYARERGLPVQPGGLCSLAAENGQVSIITMMHVLEHLVNHAHVLSTAHRLLQDDGLLITMHPTVTFFNLLGNIARLNDKRKDLPYLGGMFAAPWHTALFSTGATEQLFSRNGFRLLEIRPSPETRLGGLTSLAQIVLDMANGVGWPLLGTRWPLVTCHVFVFRKVSMPDAGVHAAGFSRARSYGRAPIL
jgi:2-polyprenyl-3-methyl-5-hydroxy-6-metoxy-1,4-benzoquinol methylase